MHFSVSLCKPKKYSDRNFRRWCQNYVCSHNCCKYKVNMLNLKQKLLKKKEVLKCYEHVL